MEAVHVCRYDGTATSLWPATVYKAVMWNRYLDAVAAQDAMDLTTLDVCSLPIGVTIFHLGSFIALHTSACAERTSTLVVYQKAE